MMDTNALPLHVAAVQMVSACALEPNLSEAGRWISEAAARGARLVVLPENFAVMGASDADTYALREKEGEGPIQNFLAHAARKHNIWLVGGTLPTAVADPARFSNTTLVFDPHGNCMARYDKIHLFAFACGDERHDETRAVQAGTAVCTFDAPCGRIGLSICYDLRFPELYRMLGDCALIIVPAAFTATTGRAHWEVLLRARAIENQCYVLAAAQGGQHENGRCTWGHSLLIDPWGEIMALHAYGAGVITGQVEPARIQEIRQRFPVHKQRRLV